MTIDESGEVRANYLLPSQLDARISDHPLAYVPLGSLEFHGHHLPIGLDGLTAHGICVRAAAITGGVVLPTLYQAVGGEHTSYPWTMMMPEAKSIEAILLQTLGRLEQFGVRGALLFSGHFAAEQTDLIDRIARQWNEREHGLLHVLATSVDRCPHSTLRADHAGIFESTLLAGLHPEIVHLERLDAAGPDEVRLQLENPFGSQRHDPGHPLWGVFGPDPRLMNLEDGPHLVEEIVGWLTDLLGRTGSTAQ